MQRDGFCPKCNVSFNLHDDEDDCEQADAKADAILRVEKAFFAPFDRK